jgi:hypothetical protein
MMTVRVGVWRLSVVIPWTLLVGFFIAGAVISPNQAVAALTAPFLVALIAWLVVRRIRLEITESVVRARQGPRGDKLVSRSEVRAIHYLPRLISFRGPDGKPIMMIRPEWTLRQMGRVADELKVPLYDHRGWGGIRTVDKGRLVYDPKSGPVARSRK